MSELTIESTRSGQVESRHRVSVAVVDAGGRLVAFAGDPELATYWRSAAKPFQALPLVQDGGGDGFGIPDQELALTCASHSSEPEHLALTDQLLARIGCVESDLACGPHVPLGRQVALEVARAGTTMTPRWSNCSGKHAGMLGLARHHGWPTADYVATSHPVQQRLLKSVAAWTDRSPDRITLGVDGCTTVCYHLDLAGMATAWARFGVSEEPAVVRLRTAYRGHPGVIAGTGRFCTDLMRATNGAVLAKVGADGIYSACIPAFGCGISLKVEDGSNHAAPAALYAVLQALVTRRNGGAGFLDLPALEGRLHAHIEPPVRTTRGADVGALRAVGSLRFPGP